MGLEEEKLELDHSEEESPDKAMPAESADCAEDPEPQTGQTEVLEPADNETEDVEESASVNAPLSVSGLVADDYGSMEIPEKDTEGRHETDFAGIQVRYGFTGEEVRTALKIFQKHTIFKRNLIYSAIIVIILAVYLFSIINTSSSKFSIFMAVLCITVLLAIWYFPLNHVRQTVKAIEEMGDQEQFVLTVYDDAVEIGEYGGRTVYTYASDPIRVWETSELYIIGHDKFRVFVVPKRYCRDKIQEMTALFQEGLKGNYKKIEG